MKAVFEVLRKIEKDKDIKVYAVGGLIRDILLERDINDIDVVVFEKAEEFAREFAKQTGGELIISNSVYKPYRVINDDEGMKVDFNNFKGNTIEEDLMNRDFTINSMAVDIENIDNINENTLIDPYNGFDDLKNKKIKITDKTRFLSDTQRMLRAVRFMSQFEFEMEEETKKLIRENSNKLMEENIIRLRDELFKILSLKDTYKYFEFMDKELDILKIMFPEVLEMKSSGKCKYHVVDVFTHSILTLKLTEEVIYSESYFEDHVREEFEKHFSEVLGENGRRTRVELVKLAAFFHDVGKPSAEKVDETGRTRFKGHEITGAEIVKNISHRFNLTIKERDILYRIVSLHMLPLVFYKSNDVSGKTLYGNFSKCKEETLDILLVALCDIVSTRMLLDPEERMGKYKIHIEYIANNYLTRYREVENISRIITGLDIIQNFDLGENVLIKDLIEEVRKAIYFGKIGPTKRSALNYIKSLVE